MSVSIIQGDCREVLRTMLAESAHCCITSPPYFGLRDYGVNGQIGLEETPDAYVAELVAVFREVKRVLRDDGTLWLNLGDSYNAYNGGAGPSSALSQGAQTTQRPKLESGFGLKVKSLKPKDLIGIPWLVAFALRADGWWLRSHIIWHKPNPMPESVTDRPTSAHESIFLLAKSERYYFDAEAVREQFTSGPSDLKKMAEGKERIGGKHKTLDDPLSKASGMTNIGQRRSVGNKQAASAALMDRGRAHRVNGFNERWDTSEEDGSVPGGRNIRNVWTIATQPFPEAHFATFPTALIEPCIKAGCPEGGTVLDPFGGAGTTGLVADRLGRNAILVELNQAYAEMARRRIHGDAPLFAEVTAGAAA
jgi:DNA modification methylase